MDLSKAKNLITRIEFLQQTMLDVATYSVDINKVNDNYKDTYNELDIELEILQEIYSDIGNPNPFSSLWDWYNFYSNQKEQKLAQRCSYVFEIYSSLYRKLHDMQCEAYLSKLSEPEKAQFMNIEMLKSINEKIETIKTIMKEVSTSGGNQTKDIVKKNEESYRNQHKSIGFQIGILSKLGTDIVNPNHFYSLWQWYSHWQSELEGYSARRQFVDELYDDLTRNIKKIIKKAELEDIQNHSFGESLFSKRDRNNEFFSSWRERQTIDDFEEVQDSLAAYNDSVHLEAAPPRFVDDEENFDIDFAIVTALEIERKKVCEALGITDSQRVKKGSRIYWIGHFNITDEYHYEILIAQCTDMGNVSSGGLSFDIINHWNPNAILMVGVAGAAQANQNLGDITLGKAVYCYEFGKVKNGSYRVESKEYQTDSILWNHILTLPEWKEPLKTPRPDGLDIRPNIHRGVIASGDKRISDAQIRDIISSQKNNVVAIEMEGYGVSEAVWQATTTKGCLVIRSICDLANSSENNDWHSYAAEVAASYAKHFLRDCPIKPKKINSFPSITGGIKNTDNYYNEGLEDSDFLELSNLLTKSGRAGQASRKSICIRISIRHEELPFVHNSSDSDFSTQLIDHLRQIDNFQAMLKLCEHIQSSLYGRSKRELESIKNKLKIKLEDGYD